MTGDFELKNTLTGVQETLESIKATRKVAEYDDSAVVIMKDRAGFALPP